MDAYQLRPLSLGELLDRTFALYRRNFWLFVGIMVIPACLLVPARAYFLHSHGVNIPWVKSSPHPKANGLTFGLLFADWILLTMAQAATTYAVADTYLGRAATVRGCYGRVRGRFLRVLGVSLNVGVRVFGLMLLLMVGGFLAGGAVVRASRGTVPDVALGLLTLGLVALGFGLAVAFAMRYAFAIPALLIEEIKGSASIRRSVLLSHGWRGQIFLAVLLGILLIYAAAVFLQGPFYAAIAMAGTPGRFSASMATGMAISGAIGQIVTSPMLTVILVVFYYDLRIRKEAFDLQQMIASLPTADPATGASPA